MFRGWKIELLREAATEGAPAGTAPPEGTAAPAGKWYEGEAFSAETRDWMKARGLQADDPMTVIPKIIQGHRAAEQRIGRGLDSILDRPAEGQKLTEWLRGNAEALGLPADEAGYSVTPPDFWPKDLPWDGALEAEARKLAFDAGVPPDVHQAYVGIFAKKMAAIEAAAATTFETARTEMMADLQRDFGGQVDVKIGQARQAAQTFAQAAGLGGEQLNAVTALLAKDTGDAGVIRLFAAIGAAMGEDRGVGLNNGGALSMTPAEAKAELDAFNSPTGEYGQAFARNDLPRMNELRAKRERLSRLAVQK